MNYRILHRLKNIPQDPHFYGYESENDFLNAISVLHRAWKDRVGRQIDERHGFVRLRIYNQYRTYKDVWFPKFMLERTVVSEKPEHDADSDMGADLDDVFGFD